METTRRTGDNMQAPLISLGSGQVYMNINHRWHMEGPFGKANSSKDGQQDTSHDDSYVHDLR
jgi:hypothetical protein